MKKTITISITLLFFQLAFGQTDFSKADSLKDQGLLMPALMKYAESMQQGPSAEASYKIASTAAR